MKHVLGMKRDVSVSPAVNAVTAAAPSDGLQHEQ